MAHGSHMVVMVFLPLCVAGICVCHTPTHHTQPSMTFFPSTRNMSAAPVALHQENVPDDLICSICMTVPAEPLITPCDHLFCRTCIHQALSDRNICPIDRRPCNLNQLRQLEGLSSRIWGGIQVKCGGHDIGCAWRGSIADYSSHVQNSCSVLNRRSSAGNFSNSAREEELESLREENTSLQTRLDEALRSNAHQTRLITDANQQIESLTTLVNILQQSLNSRPDVPTLFHGTYNFRRENVVELSQLISRYLENKPSSIDGNKIYDCVRSCYNDLERGYSDNPEHYYLDMRMLLATCLASTWFSINQKASLKRWYDAQFCNGTCSICG